MGGRVRLLDLYCGAGGAAKGYADAGWEVVGVDHKPQPNYPFEFYRLDALLALEGLYYGQVYTKGPFDAIHASPPCQRWTAYNRARPGNEANHPDLIGATRHLLYKTRKPYVIENVQGAPLANVLMLCGSMFDPPLDIRRHRFFESNVPLRTPYWPCRHKLQGPNRYPGGRSRERGGNSNRTPARNTVEIGSWDTPLEIQQRAIGIDWMTVDEMSQAIPPIFTEFIGGQLAQRLQKVAA